MFGHLKLLLHMQHIAHNSLRCSNAHWKSNFVFQPDLVHVCPAETSETSSTPPVVIEMSAVVVDVVNDQDSRADAALADVATNAVSVSIHICSC